ncbi:MAG TPA: hypothetical protein VFJ17_06095 [Mycobacteriales bacterium]|nr:hypothetical protein [Mycobacteriales bacterium]
MPRYEIRATADIESGVTFDVADLRSRTGGDIEVNGHVLTLVATCECSDPASLAYELVQPLREVSRCGIWTARRKGVPIRIRRVSGGWTTASPGDDGLGGVREPRRPMPPNGHLTAEADPTG